MASRRTKSISTKVTSEEYARLAARAGDDTISEWARGVLLRSDAPTVIEATLLAEVLALRTILLNLHFAICGGESLTPDAMRGFITVADQNKHQLANDRLREFTTRRAS